MIELGSGIGAEDDLTVMPVALADVTDVQNTRCMTTTSDLKKVSGGYLVALIVRIDGGRTIIICLSGLNPRAKSESRLHPSMYSMRRPYKVVLSGNVNCQMRVSK